ncbi:ACT domain-containing protein [Promicromonospora sp. MEB111]|uniref:ACT domain-containing protein n=1 Tax=Promicromonospora sp. MEB111 TaxID=3040301 RepID=UPI0025501668|nr:ACT domain-containing protein [Promicromonospora sp. MEB111]
MKGHLRDLEVRLPDRPGALADLGEALGAAGVSLEGGGVFTMGDVAVAHYLVHDGARALRAVTAAGLGPAVVRDVVLARLDQETPGQLGTLARRLGDAGVDVRVQYSDHVGNLVLLVADDDVAACRETVRSWGRRRQAVGRER